MSEPQSGFVRAYHLTSFDHGIGSIGLRRIKVARLSEVNDPFELFALDVKKREPRKALAKFKQELDQTHGLLCFSKRWKNPVLWSHYATGGRGIALGFDIRKDLGEQGVLDVKYEDAKLKVFDEHYSPAITPQLQQMLLVTKFKHWQYEEECRVLVTLSSAIREGGLYFYPFSDGFRLTEVVLGPLCSNALVTSVQTLTDATNPGASVMIARLGYKYFEVKQDGGRSAG